jgi:hypothetical protein
VPVFGHKNPIGIDREFGFPRAMPSPMRRRMMAANSARCSTATIPLAHDITSNRRVLLY